MPNDSAACRAKDCSKKIASCRSLNGPRFVAILLDETTWDNEAQCYCGPAYPRTILVPRSLFFDSPLYAYLNASNPVSPLNKLAFRQNSTSAASSNSDALQQVLSGNVTMGDWLTILDFPRYNATNVVVRTALRLTNDLFLYSLPDDALRLVGYTALPSTPSRIYTFSTGGTTVKPWWEQIWEGIVSTVTAFVVSAIVVAVNAFSKLVEVLAQLGAWLAAAVGAAAQAVASAVEAAGEALNQFVVALQAFIEEVVRKIVDILIRPIQGLLQDWANEVRSVLERVMGIGDTDDVDVQMLAGAIFNSRIMLLVEILATGIEVAIGAVTILSFLAPSGAAIGVIFKKVIMGALKAAFANMFLSTIIAIEVGAIIGLIIPKDSPIWGWTSAIGTLVIALVISFIQKTVAKRNGINTEPLDADRRGLILALLGFFLAVALLVTGASGIWAVIGSWTGAALAGLGLLIALKGKSWNDQLDEIIPGLGFVDELITAGTFGFTVGVAATTR